MLLGVIHFVMAVLEVMFGGWFLWHWLNQTIDPVTYDNTVGQPEWMAEPPLVFGPNYHAYRERQFMLKHGPRLRWMLEGGSLRPARGQ
jgi:hypothetical protein